MEWLIEDFESFLFGASCGAFVVLVVASIVTSWLHEQVKELRLDYERLNSKPD